MEDPGSSVSKRARPPATLRVRLAVAFAGAVTAALAIFGAVVVGVVWREEIHEQARKEHARQALSAHGSAVDAHAVDEDQDDDVERVVSAMLFSAPLVIAAAAAFGLWLSRRALLPLREASTRAQSARASELLLTLPVNGNGDEWDELATTLNQLLTDARGSMARIQRFTADAAHELRTPLTTLIGEADLALRRERSIPELRAALSVVRAESQRMATLVDALLSLSRADAGTLLSQTHPRPVSLEPLLQEAALRAQARAERTGKPFAIALSFDTTGPHLARGEPVLLARALGNLLDNAVDHGGAKVALSVRTEATALHIRIEDDGPGIAPTLRARLFERFARADASRSSDGFGLGLALSRAIAQAHGGGLDLVREGPGAAFELHLQRAESSPIV